MNNNSPPLTFKRFQTIVSRLELPRRPLLPVTQQQMDKCRTTIADNHDQLYSIPSLEELGTVDCFYYSFRNERTRTPILILMSTMGINFTFCCSLIKLRDTKVIGVRFDLVHNLTLLCVSQ